MASARAGRIAIVICLFLATCTLAGAADHLLISEVVVTPTSGEFVEIFNPTDNTVADRSSDHDGMVLYLDTASVLFADGFETGDTTMWSSATP
jgi:hypothetical protein